MWTGIHLYTVQVGVDRYTPAVTLWILRLSTPGSLAVHSVCACSIELNNHRVPIREYSFLDNPRTPQSVKVGVVTGWALHRFAPPHRSWTWVLCESVGLALNLEQVEPLNAAVGEGRCGPRRICCESFDLGMAEGTVI